MPEFDEGFRLPPPTEEEKELGKHLARKLELLEREKNKVLIIDFVKFLNEHYYPISHTGPIISVHIDEFLNERSKDNVSW